MKVMVIASEEGIGLTNHFTKFSIGLKNQDLDISVVSGCGEQIRGLEKRLDLAGISHYTINCIDNYHFYTLFSEFGKIVKVIKTEKPDIIHTNGLSHLFHLYFPSRSIFSGKKIKFVLALRNDIFYSWFAVKTLKIWSNWASVITPLCKSMERKLTELGVAQNKIVLENNFIDVENFNSIQGKYTSELENLSVFTTPGKVIGYPALLRPGKGHVFLLEAAKIVITEVPETKFLIIGDGQLMADLKKRAVDLGISRNIFFMGYIENDKIPALLSKIDIGISVSLAEQFSRSNLEIMTAGKPLICTNVGSVPDFMIDGVTGIIIQPGNVSEIAEKILHLIRDPGMAYRLGKNGKEFVENNFDVNIVANQIKRLYESLV